MVAQSVFDSRVGHRSVIESTLDVSELMMEA